VFEVGAAERNKKSFRCVQNQVRNNLGFVCRRLDLRENLEVASDNTDLISARLGNSCPLTY